MEYGGVGHAISRGNYRECMFKDDEAKGSLEERLAAAVVGMGWVAHDWVVMGSHCGLAVDTPRGNPESGSQ